MVNENRQKAKEDFKQFMGSAKKAMEELGTEIAVTANQLLEDAKVAKRQLVVSVRLDDESVKRVQQLVETGICQSRSEAVAFLAREGIRARQEMFQHIEEKIDEIRRIREELKKEVQ